MNLFKLIDLLLSLLVITYAFGLLLLVGGIDTLLGLGISGTDKFFLAIGLIGGLPLMGAMKILIPNILRGVLPPREIVGAVVMTSPMWLWVCGVYFVHRLMFP